MIRVRAKSGKTIVIEEPLEYVEILDVHGDVAMVFHKESIFGQEAINIIYPDHDMDDANLYTKLYGVNWTKTIKGSWPKSEPLVVDLEVRK